MATQFISNSWLMPANANKDKLSNYSLDFDSASSQYLNFGTSLGDSIGDNYTDSISFSLWFKANTTTGDDGLIWWSSSSPSNGELSVWIQSNNINVQMYGGSTQSYSFTDISNWHHLVITLKPSGSKMYLDNIDTGLSWTYSDLDVDNNTLYIGTYYSTSYTFDGNITEASVFDYELSASQVLELYGTGSAVGNPMSLATKPVAYYPLGDSAFNGEFLATNNATELYENYALDFDGTNDYISVPNSTDFDYGTGDFTWSFWLNVDTHVNYAGLFYFASSGAPYRLKIQSDTTIFLDADTNDVQIADLGTGLAGSGWHSLIFVRNSGTITTYLDGSQVDSVSYSHALNSGGNPLIIANNGGSYLNGKLSNISIYNSALTSGQVTTLYNSGKPFDLNTFAVTPVSWWRLGATGSSFNGSIWTVLDEIGSNNGTGNNLNPPQSALVDGIGASGNGVSSGMSSGTNKTGDSPYSTNNAVSYNMSVTAESTSVPT